VSHKVDEVKREKLNKLGLNTFEIDLSHLTKLAIITIEDVIEAINDSQYQTVIYLADSFVKSSVAKVTNDVESKIITRNDAINQWLVGVNSKLIGNGYTLPMNTLDSLEQLDSENPPPPVLNKHLQVKQFSHDSNKRFLLHLANRQEVKVLPVYIITPTSSLLTDDTDYLTMEVALINPKAPKLIANWGRSSRMKAYNDRCKNKRAAKKAKIIEYDLQKVNRNLSQINHLIESDERLSCANANEIEALAMNNHNEMINNGVPVAKLNFLYDDMADLLSIYGCPALHWQTILIFEMYNQNTEEFSVEWAASVLKSHRIDVIGPFRELAFLSKFIKAQHIELPFSSSYRMLSSYLTHLSSFYFIERVNRRGRYQLRSTYESL